MYFAYVLFGVKDKCQCVVNIFIVLLLDILRDDRLTIVINKMDEALKKKRGDKRCYTKDSVISDVQKYFCTVVFQCKPEEWPKKCIIVLCSSWSLYTRILEEEDSQHLVDLCRTTLLSDSSKKSLNEEPDIKKQNQVLEECSNILELESRYMALLLHQDR